MAGAIFLVVVAGSMAALLVWLMDAGVVSVVVVWLQIYVMGCFRLQCAFGIRTRQLLSLRFSDSPRHLGIVSIPNWPDGKWEALIRIDVKTKYKSCLLKSSVVVQFDLYSWSK